MSNDYRELENPVLASARFRLAVRVAELENEAATLRADNERLAGENLTLRLDFDLANADNERLRAENEQLKRDALRRLQAWEG